MYRTHLTDQILLKVSPLHSVHGLVMQWYYRVARLVVEDGDLVLGSNQLNLNRLFNMLLMRRIHEIDS